MDTHQQRDFIDDLKLFKYNVLLLEVEICPTTFAEPTYQSFYNHLRIYGYLWN